MIPLTSALLLVLVVTQQASSEYDDIKKLALANNELAFKLHKAFNLGGNAFTSPASIFIALSMLYQGARGITAEEMREVLSFSVAGLTDRNINQHFQELFSLLGRSSGEYKLNIANAILSQSRSPVLKDYKDVLERYYNAKLKEVDFARENAKAVEEVNNWVSDKTNNKITNLLDAIPADTVLLLLNAVYFKGTWKTQFSPRTTREAAFYNDGINEVSVQMMGAKNKFFYGDFNHYGVQAVKLPYNGEDMSMIILLPYKRDGLQKVEQQLNPSKLDDIISKMELETVIVNIPKFKLEDKKELKLNLTNLGMRSAFVNGANFAGITNEGNLKVSEIVHKAVVEVNEEGSEAAGASAVLIVPYSSGNVVQYFGADHPFIFFIRDDRTGMILFYGRVNNL